MKIRTILQKYGYDKTTGKEEIQDWKDFKEGIWFFLTSRIFFSQEYKFK